MPTGATGTEGAQGPQDNQGEPGDVTVANLRSAIGGTAANANVMSMMDMSFPDPDMKPLRARFNELILAPRR